MAETFDISALREAVHAGRITWHLHAFERLLERGIRRSEVLHAIMVGEVIERYEADKPFPSGLIFHTETQPLHVVASIDKRAMECHIITACRPDTDHFESDFKTRRKRDA